jgi:hypothetical protein
MSSQPKICLITPGHVASTPRLVKSADALQEAGYKVHVLAGAPFPPADILDANVLGNARWEYTSLRSRGGPTANLRKILRKLDRRLMAYGPFATVNRSASAHLAEARHLARRASQIGSDLYIGHCLGGLYAAAEAARKTHRLFGFDIEDYHDGETPEATEDMIEVRARFILQSRLLPKCRVLTAASPLIARKYLENYQVDPITVLNVFPLSQAPETPVPALPITNDRPARFYWFSQTIGEGRGLEKMIEILALMSTPAELHLRGFVARGYAEHLQSTAIKKGLKRPLSFLAPGPPGEMARLASTADMGVASEEPPPLNKDICLANKIFIYLLAGIPQLLSNTAAQLAIGRDLGEAALVTDFSRPESAAKLLDSFLADPGRVVRARQAAWRHAHERYSWDVEKKVLLEAVGKVLPVSP